MLDNWMNRHSKLNGYAFRCVVCFPRFRQGVEIDTEKILFPVAEQLSKHMLDPDTGLNKVKEASAWTAGKEAQFAEGLQNIDLAIAQSLI